MRPASSDLAPSARMILETAGLVKIAGRERRCRNPLRPIDATAECWWDRRMVRCCGGLSPRSSMTPVLLTHGRDGCSLLCRLRISKSCLPIACINPRQPVRLRLRGSLPRNGRPAEARLESSLPSRAALPGDDDRAKEGNMAAPRHLNETVVVESIQPRRYRHP